METYTREDAETPVENVIAQEDEIAEWQQICDKHAKGARPST
jgi:hypothetical protein